MKFSLGWIKEFVHADVPPRDLAARLTSAGLPVETVDEGPDGDAILDIEIFSNRPDCMNVYGVAREVAAATGHALCPYPGDLSDPGPAASSLTKVTIEDPDLCGRYCARLIQDVKVGPSPGWLVSRLASIGLRPVNNVVDVTNYVLWEYGHPLHAFDFDTLSGREIRVRRARKGESLVTLDDVTRRLLADMLVIADANRAVALAGIMGGAKTMVRDGTVNLLIESAHFDPVSVRRTSKSLGLSTDASYRFERIADIEATVKALNRVTSLIQQLAGGTVCEGIVEDRPSPPARRRLRVRPSRARSLLGIDVTDEQVIAALRSLQFTVAQRDEALEVEVPSHRQDVDREVDLIEEVARSIGYDAVESRIPHIPGSGGVNRSGHGKEIRLRRALSALGCSEAVTSSFSTAKVDWAFRQRLDESEPAIEPILLSNPITADQEILRTTILPGLLQAVSHNVNRGSKDVRLFEIGRTFRRGAAPGADHGDRKHPRVGPVTEIVRLGVAVSGSVRSRSWLEPGRETSFHDLKGLVATVLEEAGLSCGFAGYQPLESLKESPAALVTVAGRPVGRIGSLSAAWRERFDVKQEIHVAEIDLSALSLIPDEVTAFRPLPRYPSVSRDLSLIVSRAQAYGELEETIRKTAPDKITNVSVLDLYEGANLEPGTVGLTINVVYQDPGQTLESDEITRLQQGVLEALSSRFGVRLRD